MTSDLLVGFGEIGYGLYCVLSERRPMQVHDPAKGHEAKPGERYDWMHICIPYSESFTRYVNVYIEMYQPRYTMIHSTVPIGTTRKLAEENPNVIYSPIRGRHPRMERSIREFPKYYAVLNDGEMDVAVTKYFAAAGMQTRKAPSFECLEWAKLWETSTYAVSLLMWMELEREAKELPGGSTVNLNMMKSWLYEKRKVYDGDIGMVPVYDVVPGPLGGHCLRPNIELLKDVMSPEMYAWMTTTDDARKER